MNLAVGPTTPSIHRHASDADIRHFIHRNLRNAVLDIQEDAIIKARENTGIAKQVIHYINRDFFQFKQDHLFDEVITNMPFKIGRFTEDEVYQIYERFFQTIPALLKEGAVLILYTHNKEDLIRLTFRTQFSILKDYEISKKEGTHVVILRYMSK